MGNMIRGKQVLSIVLAVLVALAFTGMTATQVDAKSKKKTVYLLVKTTYKDRNGSSTTRFKYDKRGLEKTRTIRDSDSKIMVTTKRNAKGAPTSIKTRSDGKLTSKVRNKFNKKGLKIQAKAYSVEKGKAKLSGTTTFKYYKNGKLKESVYSASDYKVTTKYNNKGIATSEVIKSPDYSQSSKFNGKGDTVEVTYDGTYTKGTTSTTYEYDKNGNMTRQVDTDKSVDKKDGTETTTVSTSVYKNKYDKHKNIVRRTVTDTIVEDGKEIYNITSTETNKYKARKIARKYLKYLDM